MLCVVTWACERGWQWVGRIRTWWECRGWWAASWPWGWIAFYQSIAETREPAVALDGDGERRSVRVARRCAARGLGAALPAKFLPSGLRPCETGIAHPSQACPVIRCSRPTTNGPLSSSKVVDDNAPEHVYSLYATHTLHVAYSPTRGRTNSPSSKHS